MGYFTAILVYLFILIGFGVYFSRRIRGGTDFHVAGRRLPVRVLVGTLIATWIGSGSIIAGAGFAYREGFSGLWMSVGAWAGIIILYFVAGRVRKLEQFTVPDILELRYNKWARILSTITTIIAYTAIVSYQFRAGGFVLNIVTGIPQEQGMIITAVFVIAYTAIGGLISVAYTDVVNGIVMLLGIGIGLPFLLSDVGGVSGLISRLPETRFTPMGNMSIIEALGFALPTMFLLLGESNMYQRFFSARDSRGARKAVIGWAAGTIIIEIMIVFTAICGSAIYPDINSETVMIHIARYSLHPVIGILLLSALVAVIVSTADSFLLVPSTNIVRDVYLRFINPNLSESKVVALSRIVVIILGLFAFMQISFFTTVLEMALYAYTMYGAAITPALLASFFWKRGTPAGGAASVGAGIVTTLLWESAGQPLGLATIYPAITVSITTLVTVSLFTPKPDNTKLKPFFG